MTCILSDKFYYLFIGSMDSQSFYSSLYGERREEINERNEIEAEVSYLMTRPQQERIRTKANIIITDFPKTV